MISRMAKGTCLLAHMSNPSRTVDVKPLNPERDDGSSDASDWPSSEETPMPTSRRTSTPSAEAVIGQRCSARPIKQGSATDPDAQITGLALWIRRPKVNIKTICLYGWR
ncbi:hypothetical protein EG329_006119 [Mollisiaceae sp. DMI_Dod_QoI]|nr:hypothetical protein EG329_006119 [Helotiales sp. DMI_Dod_QoI]